MLFVNNRIGNNAIVGMAPIVINDINSRTTVAGSPAKPLKKNKYFKGGK